MTNSDTKTLIESAKTFEQADNALNQTWCKTDADKLEYLRQIFPERFNGEFRADNPHEEYVSFIMSIIHGTTNEPFQYGYKKGLEVGHKIGCYDIVKHIVKEWNVLRKLSLDGIKTHFEKYLHEDINKILE